MKNKNYQRGGAFALAGLIPIAALCLCASVAKAQVPTYDYPTVFSALTLPAGITNLATPYVIDVRKQKDVSLEALGRGVTTATNIYAMSWSLDGSTFSTNATDRILWAPDYPSAVSDRRGTNIACGGHGYLIIYNVFSTQQSTNTLRYGTKISAP